MLLISLFLASPVIALDTDIYQANVKQNAYILLDNSGSMEYGVYESNIDYGAMYDYLYEKDDIGDTVVGGSGWYGNHYEKNKIFLVKGEISATLINIDGETQVFTGDAADPDYLWYSNDMIDTHTYIDTLGNISGEDGETQRLTVNEAGYILLDGVELPLGQSILLNDTSSLYDGSQINEGFGGLVNAPGYYFSGLEGVGSDADHHNIVENGDEDIYFFITGNWMNMQQMYNLHYTSNPSGSAGTGDPAWQYEKFPLESEDWSVVAYDLDYPSGGGDYTNNLKERDTAIKIVHAGAEKIQIHFSMFDIEGDGRTSQFRYDYLALYDSEGTLIAQYDNDNSPQGDWSPTITGDTVWVKFKSDRYETRKGYTVDQYRVTYGSGDDDESGTYLMQNRLDVAKDAMLYVVDEFRGKINWGFATFAYNGTTANGATFGPYLNPTVNDDTNRQAIVTQLENTQPMFGTPLGEALQDVFEDGYYRKRNSLDNLLCRKNYAIVVSDGYPSGDEDWSRINGVTFSDFDGDNFTADPYQYSNPPDNYYDDVAHWIYTHSWLDKSKISNPEDSYENIIPHQIAFGAKHPLMHNAAGESGAEYITAYNKTQLVNAFYSLGLMISKSISFTAPVVSVDESNKIENGDDLYMGQFLPSDSTFWPGNVKKFRLGDELANEDPGQIYDADGNEATDSEGHFLDNLTGFWGDSNDGNDSDNYGGGDIQEDGVGEVLTERVASAFSTANYYERNIKTVINGSLVDFTQNNVSAETLGLTSSDTELRNKTVNFIYGYTFDADSDTGAPVATRDWALGAIVHSQPIVIDYYNTNDFSILDERLIAVGSNDGMLHVFDEGSGSEIFAFIPSDLLTKLPAFETEVHQPMVDGLVSVFKIKGQPKYLFFGLRRGGNSYWRIDISDPDPSTWTATQFTHNELGQSWSEVQFSKIQTGESTFKNVAIFTAGYDPTEDDYPEPFVDLDNNGTPYTSAGNIANQEWRSSNSSQDVNGNNTYDTHNAAGDNYGRGIFVIDVDTLEIVFSTLHGATNDPTVPGYYSNLTNQVRSDFLYCFPASPSIFNQSQKYTYTADDGTTIIDREREVLQAIYAIDIYGNLYRISYVYGDTPKWRVKHIFSANPGSNSPSGTLGNGLVSNKPWRKTFYGPAVSWKGSGYNFDPSYYNYPNAVFYNRHYIASLFFGTGDRVHPSYQIAKNRVYAIYDDSPVYTMTDETFYVGSTPYSEDDLLNVTCDELGLNTNQTSGNTSSYKVSLQSLLIDDVLNTTTSEPMELSTSGAGENDAKGWYIILEDQGDDDYCDHCIYAGTVDNEKGGRDYHIGEKVLSKLTLYEGSLLFTTYQPAFYDPCAPQGNAFSYDINYLNGAAMHNLNLGNDITIGDKTTVQYDVTDRYGKDSGIQGIPSSIEIIINNGNVYGAGNVGDRLPIEKVGDDDKGLKLKYWIER